MSSWDNISLSFKFVCSICNSMNVCEESTHHRWICSLVHPSYDTSRGIRDNSGCIINTKLTHRQNKKQMFNPKERKVELWSSPPHWRGLIKTLVSSSVLIPSQRWSKSEHMCPRHVKKLFINRWIKVVMVLLTHPDHIKQHLIFKSKQHWCVLRASFKSALKLELLPLFLFFFAKPSKPIKDTLFLTYLVFQ